MTLSPSLQSMASPLLKTRKRRASGSRRYPYKWRKARAAYLAHHAACVNIGQRGCTGTATCVDHIKDHRGSAALYWDRRNWQPMCHHCHSVKTAKSKLRPVRQLRYDVHGVPTDADHLKEIT